MKYLIAMPRSTDTSLFTNFISQVLISIAAILGVVLVLAVFYQNYQKWVERKTRAYDNEERKAFEKKAANRDFGSCIFVSIVLLIFFVILLICVWWKSN